MVLRVPWLVDYRKIALMEDVMQTSLEIKKPNGSEMVINQPTPMDLLNIALNNNAAIDVIERLAALQEKAQARDAEMQFNQAMNAAQAELRRVAPDLENPQTHSAYASYAALDRALRPIYIKHGFSLSFDAGEAPADTVRVLCYVSHAAGHTRKYQSPPMPADGKGAKGGDVMTKTHATGAAMSYGMRYLLKYIFNVAIGQDDTDGNVGIDDIQERLEFIANCRNFDELKAEFKKHYTAAKQAKDNRSEKLIVEAYENKKKEFHANR